jgi:hypothetical protein
VQIDSRTVTTSDIGITYSNTSPANFISSTGEIRLRVYSTGGTSNYTCSGDWLQFTVQSTSNLKPGSNYPMVSNNIDDLLIYPNPTIDLAIAKYNLSTESKVSISIYDPRGVKIRDIITNKQNTPGLNEAHFSTLNLTNGIYYLKLYHDNITSTIPFIIQH